MTRRLKPSRWTGTPAVASSANGGAAGAAPLDPVASPLSMLISRHMFQEGEIIELATRPSAWWIVLNCWRTLAASALIMLVAVTLGDYLPGRRGWYIEAGLLVGAGRLMWATTRWMSRLHILTNMRVMTISGVFNPTVRECPLRRLARLRDTSLWCERIVFAGTVELIPMDETFPITQWQTIHRPAEVLRKIRSAMERAQQKGSA